MKFILTLLILSLGACSSSNKRSDLYKNFSELQKNEDSKNYSIETKKRKSDVLVLAPHGGRIEYGTTDIAKSLAGKKWSYYAFNGKLKEGNFRLHITSHNFDEPKALEMVGEHEVCITIHGYKSELSDPNICFGGRNDELGNRIHTSLRKLGLQNTDEFNGCARFYGQNENNIVNRCELEGVQMELSKSFREELLKSNKTRRRFNKAIHAAVKQYLSEAHQ